MMAATPRDTLLTLYQHGLQAVLGESCVVAALEGQLFEVPQYLVAIGKAAPSMFYGALRVLGERLGPALVVSKYGHGDEQLSRLPGVRYLEAAHPTPDQNSLQAGAELLAFLQQAPADGQFLFLISGGASALVETLPPGMTLEDLQRVNRYLLASGLPIQQMNQVRKSLSLIKGGRLLSALAGRQAQALLISDVLGDDPAVIGSAPLLPGKPLDPALLARLPDWLQELLAQVGQPVPVKNGVPHRIVANNQLARDRIAQRARESGLAVSQQGEIDGDALVVGRQLAQFLLTAEPGIHIWGGETTVQLPENPGRGGRCQALALAAAQSLQGQSGVMLLAAGTDGTDGPGEDAGALVDGGTIQRGADEGQDVELALLRADAGSFLAAAGDLLQTGPTGTNVMDLVIGYKQ